jgi:hypothetical protein
LGIYYSLCQKLKINKLSIIENKIKSTFIFRNNSNRTLLISLAYLSQFYHKKIQINKISLIESMKFLTFTGLAGLFVAASSLTIHPQNHNA